MEWLCVHVCVNCESAIWTDVSYGDGLCVLVCKCLAWQVSGRWVSNAQYDCSGSGEKDGVEVVKVRFDSEGNLGMGD